MIRVYMIKIISLIVGTLIFISITIPIQAQELPETLPIVTLINGVAHMHVVTPGTWDLRPAFMVTRPDGTNAACVIGNYTKNTPELAVDLECVEFKDTKSYLGFPDGSLVLKEH